VVELRFAWLVAPTPGPAELRFGSPGYEAARVEATLAADLPPVDLPALSFSGTALRERLLWTDEGPALRMPHRDQAPVAAGLRMGHHDADPGTAALWMPHQALLPLPVGLMLAWQQMQPLQVGTRARDAQALPLPFGIRLAHAETLRQQRAIYERAAQALPLRVGVRLAHAETIRSRPGLRFGWQQMIPVPFGVRVRQQFALQVATRLWMPHQQMIPLPVGYWRPPPPPPPPPPPDPFVRLRFCRLYDGSARLRFGECWRFAPPDWIVVPIREVYIVINTFSLIRVSDGTELDALDFDAQLAADSFTWTFSTTLPGSHLSLIRPAPGAPPVELLATLNGTAIRLIAEKFKRDRVFGKSVIRVSGRGRAAWLAEPYSPIITAANAETRDAQQLIGDALQVNGVPLPWDLDWRMEDWSVPAGAWSHVGTYLSVVQRIAEAGGGYVQGHYTAETLILRPWYPLPPWQWAGADPDVALPDAACITEGIEWLEKPGYNAVWVVGGASGRRDKVKRTGSAGDYHAPTIIDPLATAIAMTRQRGLRALADTGRQALIDVSLPVLPETGILHPGLLVDYTENAVTRRGYTRSVSIRYQFPSAAQTVRIETHEPVS
jgi:hypothetical protein